MNDITIRRMTLEDAKDVWTIENATFPTPWRVTER